MVGELRRLSRLHGEFLKYPLENFGLYDKMHPLTLEETETNINKGMGGDCNALSNYISMKLLEQGFDARGIYFDNNVPEIDRTIEVMEPVDRKYHVAVEVRVKGMSYIVDVGLQFEEPIPLNGEAEYVFPTKILRVVPRSDETYTLIRVDRGNRKIELELDLKETWTEAECERVAWNNFYRDIKLKYGILRDGKKLGMKVVGDIGTIIGKTREGAVVLHEGGLESCANYLGADVAMFKRGHENFVTLRAKQKGGWKWTRS